MAASLTRRTWHGFQDRLLHLLSNDVSRRDAVVQQMLHRDANESLSYWLQLAVAVGIATLGLVVGSAAVVIGAMLIAPLMGPIVGLAMGLSTGSPFLVLRSAGRIVLSVALAVGGAAGITLLLPFHELNSELLARSTPTVLDLITAGFCALIGVYATLRAGSDTASTAAGTSIGISLVPPLCASGYGLGTGADVLARGAALLFLTNLVAIVAIGSLCFVAAGFNRVDVVALERAELAEGDDAPIARVLARRLASLFESKLGPLLRFIMPLVLLGLVYLPLRRALDEVAWEVTVRRAVKDALEAEKRPIIESKAQVARHAVELVVVLLGTTEDAEGVRGRLEQRIGKASGVKPRLEVVAVPDSRAFAGLASTISTPHVFPSAEPQRSVGERSREALSEVLRDARSVWPSEAAGELRSIAMESGEGSARVWVRHWGEPLQPGSVEVLQKTLQERLGSSVQLIDQALPVALIDRGGGDASFLIAAAELIETARAFPGALICVERPAAAARGKRPTAEERELEASFSRLVDEAGHKQERGGADFSLQVVFGDCPQPPTTPGAAGTGRP